MISQDIQDLITKRNNLPQGAVRDLYNEILGEMRFSLTASKNASREQTDLDVYFGVELGDVRLSA